MKFVTQLLVYISILIASHAQGQCKEWIWPRDSAKAREELVLFQDAVNNKQFRQASSHLRWLLVNSPNLNVSIYIMGAETYDGLAAKEKNPSKKKTLVDSLLLIYDLRMQHCNDKANVITRKALASYKHNINGTEQDKLLTLMDEAIELNGESIQDGVLLPYMETILMSHAKVKKLLQEEILKRYEKLVDIIEAKIKSGKGDDKRQAKLKEYKSRIDDLLLKMIKVDCNFVHSNLAPKFNQNPQDIVLAKRIFGYLLNGKCDRDSLWFKAGEVLYQNEKDYGLAKNLALQFLVSKKYSEASHYLKEALQLSPSGRDSSEIYVYQGSLHAKDGDKPNARLCFRNALRSDPGNKDALSSIGDLYYSSFEDCAKKVSMADDRLVYLVAYDYYLKAGNKTKMALAKKAFPSREEIFLVNYKSGEAIQVGCWIEESTIIRTRD